LTRTEEFDGVMVCSGHHAEKKMPRFQGQDKFEGKMVHSHDYTDFRGYEGKRVIVVGIGNSGVDVTVELSKISDQVCRPTYIVTLDC
jgi:dimethylaniline monooxygenase (N-oxide forming)